MYIYIGYTGHHGARQATYCRFVALQATIVLVHLCGVMTEPPSLQRLPAPCGPIRPPALQFVVHVRVRGVTPERLPPSPLSPAPSSLQPHPPSHLIRRACAHARARARCHA